MYHRGVDPLNV